MDAAVLFGIGSAITWEVSKSIQINAYLLPDVVVGNLPIVSIAVMYNIRKIFGTSNTVVDVAFYIYSHAFPQNFLFSMLNVLANP